MLKQKRNSQQNQQGDTIIEVLFCILIIGVALVMAFQTGNRSLIALQRSQERTEAVKLVEQQIESLRYVARGANQTERERFYEILTAQAPPRPVCLVPSQRSTTGLIEDFAELNIQVFAADADICKTNDLYVSQIETDGKSDTLGTYYDFKITVSWDGLPGSPAPQESVEMYYRLNREQL